MHKLSQKIILVIMAIFIFSAINVCAEQEMANPNKKGKIRPEYAQAGFQEQKYEKLQFMFEDSLYKYYTTDAEIKYFMEVYKNHDEPSYKTVPKLDKINIKIFFEPKSSKDKQTLEYEISVFNPNANVILTNKIKNKNLWAVARTVNFNSNEHYIVIFEEIYYNNEGDAFAWSSEKSYTRQDKSMPYKEIYSLESNKYYKELFKEVSGFLEERYKEYKNKKGD